MITKNTKKILTISISLLATILFIISIEYNFYKLYIIVFILFIIYNIAKTWKFQKEMWTQQFDMTFEIIKSYGRKRKPK